MSETKQDILANAIKSTLANSRRVEHRTDELIQVNEILEFLGEHLEGRSFDKLNIDLILRAQAKLSILNINIGIKAAEYAMRANLSYGYKKFEYASEWKNTKEAISKKTGIKVTNGDIESELADLNWKNFQKEMYDKVQSDKMIAVNKGVDSLIITLGYRAKQLMQEKFTTGAQGNYN